MDDLRMCPFCGCTDVVYEKIHHLINGKELFMARCQKCDANSVIGTKEEVARAWNRRVFFIEIPDANPPPTFEVRGLALEIMLMIKAACPMIHKGVKESIPCAKCPIRNASICDPLDQEWMMLGRKYLEETLMNLKNN